MGPAGTAGLMPGDPIGPDIAPPTDGAAAAGLAGHGRVLYRLPDGRVRVALGERAATVASPIGGVVRGGERRPPRPPGRGPGPARDAGRRRGHARRAGPGRGRAGRRAATVGHRRGQPRRDPRGRCPDRPGGARPGARHGRARRRGGRPRQPRPARLPRLRGASAGGPARRRRRSPCSCSMGTASGPSPRRSGPCCWPPPAARWPSASTRHSSCCRPTCALPAAAVDRVRICAGVWAGREGSFVRAAGRVRWAGGLESDAGLVRLDPLGGRGGGTGRARARWPTWRRCRDRGAAGGR